MYLFRMLLLFVYFIIPFYYIAFHCNTKYSFYESNICIITSCFNYMLNVFAFWFLLLMGFIICTILWDIAVEIYKFGIMIIYVYNHGLNSYFRCISNSMN